MKEYAFFWNWLSAVKGSCPSPSSDYIFFELKKISEKQAAEIGCAFLHLMLKLDKATVWQAGSLINGAPLGDDGFEYFRSWIIWGGEEVYDAVVVDADNILNCKVDLSNPAFEALGVCAEFVVVSEGAKIPPFEDVRSDAWNWQIALGSMERDVPNLWRIYGKGFCSQLICDESGEFLDIPGLGIIRVGDRINHRLGYGDGVVVEILSSETGLAKIKFASETKPFRITAEFFSRNE